MRQASAAGRAVRLQSKINVFVSFFAVILPSSGSAFWCNGHFDYRNVMGPTLNASVSQSAALTLARCFCRVGVAETVEVARTLPCSSPAFLKALVALSQFQKF